VSNPTHRSVLERIIKMSTHRSVLERIIKMSEFINRSTDSDPAIFVIDLQDVNKNLLFVFRVFLLITF
jgi:hypothetical protein